MTYRSLEWQLEERRKGLEQERRELDAELERLEKVGERRDAVESELRDVQAALSEVAGQRHSSALDRIQVAAPCNARWQDMVGDERTRFCARCSKHVYNLSAMTSAEALALVYEKEGQLCARFYRRADGTLITSDCPVGSRRHRRRRLALVGAAAATIATACGAMGEATLVQGAIEPVPEVHAPPPAPEREVVGVIAADDLPLPPIKPLRAE